ncbi:MAG: tRNA preQ1(34) S-adenosylmethionine ribosyltransferase-isomerase QueA [Victivallales bacterium]|nr:tRNA preQ1(34) S-adenosylmethionine ribosyltransferase-isomerase QueA [Victivallales bacterium]
MKVTDFDYHLPEELIAQHPAERRELSKLLVMGRDTGDCQLRGFADFPDYVRAGDCLVVNDTRVIAARLFGRRDPSGGRVEAFVLEERGPSRWQCLLRPGRRLNSGARVILDEDAGAFVVTARLDDGTFEVEFDTADVLGLLERAGRVPLPPYIQREASAEDRERYQTVYADRPGAVAAPTAGLHFTPEILAAVAAKGVQLVRVTLHVGPGTFQPVKAERVEDHIMHEEAYEIPPEAAATINATRVAGGRIIAVGTTSVRTLESCADPATRSVRAGKGRTRIFLHPPKHPVVVDALLTNFHLPRSTLLMLVSCFATPEHVMAAYRLAVQERLRFYSYGDAMLLLPDA